MRHEIQRALLALALALAVLMNGYSAERYIEDVISGKQVVCKWVRLAVERHLKDLDRAASGDPSFPYYFDEEAAKRVIDFKQQLRHTKGEWANPRRHDTHLLLEPWQQFKDWVLFGWRGKDGFRRFRTAFLTMARKNGKTTDGAATAVYCFLADRPREFGAEVYCAATKRDQAKITWDDACRQIERQPILRSLTKSYHNSITVPGTAAKFAPLGKDSKTEDGLNPHFALIDEFHAHPTDEMANVIVSGMGARQQPLLYYTTTAGFDRISPCFTEQERAQRILEGVSADETYFALIYTLDAEDDWTDEAVWIKANPNLGVSVKWEFLRGRVAEALDSPVKRNDVLTKNLNLWTQSVSVWIPPEKWAACDFDVNEKELIGKRCFAGLDLSTNIDITAYVLCFPPDEKGGKYRFLYRFYIPEQNIVDRERRDKVPYSYWVNEGYITAAGTDSIDYDEIEEAIRRDAKIYRLQEVDYDPYNANEIVKHLSDEGIQMVEFRQSFMMLTPAARMFDQKIRSQEIAHGGNPVMSWMVDCTEIKQTSDDLIKPVKPDRRKTGKRIDGVSASIMALYRAVLVEDDNDDFDVGAVYARSS